MVLYFRRHIILMVITWGSSNLNNCSLVCYFLFHIFIKNILLFQILYLLQHTVNMHIRWPHLSSSNFWENFHIYIRQILRSHGVCMLKYSSFIGLPDLNYTKLVTNFIAIRCFLKNLPAIGHQLLRPLHFWDVIQHSLIVIDIFSTTFKGLSRPERHFTLQDWTNRLSQKCW